MGRQNDLIQGLREYSEKRRISHQNLSKQLGVSFVTLNQWLQGHRKLRLDESKRIEKFLQR